MTVTEPEDKKRSRETVFEDSTATAKITSDGNTSSTKNPGNGGTSDSDSDPSDSQKGAYFQAFAAGSIASSCCLIQPGFNFLSYLNIMHIGCAGFNKFLGPLRPYTRAMTVAWLLDKWIRLSPLVEKKKDYECCNQNSRKTLMLSSIMCFSLMFMPEALNFAGDWKNETLMRSSQDQQRQLTKLEFVVDNMGCEACVKAVEDAVSQHEDVVVGKIISFDTGDINIFVDSSILVDQSRQQSFERELDDLLRLGGYEIHEKGWTTKKMKAAAKKVKNPFSVK